MKSNKTFRSNSSTVNAFNILGIRFIQPNLPGTLEGAIAGQPNSKKTVLTCLIMLLHIVSGWSISLIGGTTILNLTLQTPPYWQSTVPMLLTVIVWTVVTVHRGIPTGVQTATLSLVTTLALIFLLILFGWLPADPVFLITTAIFTILAIGFAALSLFTSALAIYLSSVLVKHDKLFNLIFGVLIVLTAVTMASLLLSPSSLDNSSYRTPNPSLYVRASTLLGCLSSESLIAFFSLQAAQLATGERKDLKFLRDWAIALCSWGGTSFYNLDLSDVKFTGAELPNTDLRARKLYRTCFQGVTGLERARVDNKYLDLENRKVQKLLTRKPGEDNEDKDFSRINLQGAYLQGVDMQKFHLIESNLTGADLRGADLRDSILVRAQATGVDFTGAKLTGICIEDWSVNSQTIFSGVECNYIYRKYENGQPAERYPALGRDFEPGEFEALHQEVDNVVELVFKDGVNWRAFGFTLEKIEIEDDGLGLKVKGVEKRGELFVVKVAHKEGVPRQDVEERIYQNYDEILKLVMLNSQQLNQLTGITTNLATALNEVSKRLGNSNFFLIVGSDITNLTGSGRINYEEASNTIRSIVANGCEPAQIAPLAQNLLEQFQSQKVATDVAQQAELIEQVILDQANKDPFFKQFFVQQSQQIADAIPESTIASAIRNAIAQLT